MAKRKVKAIKEAKFQYIRFATHRGWYAGLARRGTKFIHVLWFGNGYPLSVVKLGHEEARYFETLGPIDQGVQSWAKFKRSVSWTKQAERLYSEAEAYVKGGGK